MGYCPSMGDNVRERLITILGIIRNNITLSLFFAFALGGGAAYFFLGNLSYVENIKDKTSSDITIESDVSSGGSTEGTIYADIAGAVVSPGVYQLPAGSRFVDLLGEAGGFSNDVSVEWVSMNMNLSKVISDADKVYIPFDWDVEESSSNVIQSYSLGSAGPDNPGTNAALSSAKNAASVNTSDSNSSLTSNGSSNTQLLNINTASKNELMDLPGIGEVYSQKIIDQRPIANFNDLNERIKLPKSAVEKIKDLITF